jgi:8-oxo-dGTP pyrophosphatase MutT (NUDIX family)
MASGHPKCSFGIALLRGGNGKPHELLCVQRRYTYAFAEFIHARYRRKKERNNTRANSNVVQLLNQMTSEELQDVATLDFRIMWNRVWRNDPDQVPLYIDKRMKFFENFMQSDGGAVLQSLVRDARGCGVLWWEAPKGKKTAPSETDIECAVREFSEETKLTRSHYQLHMPLQRITFTHTTQGITYITVLFCAHALQPLDDGPSRPLDSSHMGTHSVEIADVRWIPTPELQYTVPSDSISLSVVARAAIANYKRWKKGTPHRRQVKK